MRLPEIVAAIILNKFISKFHNENYCQLVSWVDERIPNLCEISG
jgi:hypothetical protein